MPATYKDNGGSVNGSNKEFTYDFPVLKIEDVKVALNATTQATTKYEVSLSPAKITFNDTSVDSTVQESDGAPKSGVTVRVYRETTVGKNSGDEDPKAVFASGNSIRAGDLNANFEQTLYGIHELQERPKNTEDYADDSIDGSKIKDDAIGAKHIEDLDANVKWLDTQKAVFGTGADLQIYHDSTDSLINNENGHLYIQNSGSNDDKNIYIRARDGENSIRCEDDAGVTLYFNNAAKIATTDTGATLTGVLISDGLSVGDNDPIRLGAGGALKIYHDGSNSYLRNTTGTLFIQGSGNVVIEDVGGDNYFRGESGGQAQIYYDNSLKINTTSGGAKITGSLTVDEITLGDNEKIKLGNSTDIEIYHDGTSSYVSNTTGNLYIESKAGETALQIIPDGAVDLRYNGSKKFETSSTGATLTGVLISDGVDVSDNDPIRLGAGNDLVLKHNGTNSLIENSTGNLNFTCSGDDINLQSSDDIYLKPQGGEAGVDIVGNGAVILYHDNAEKLRTKTDGIDVTGVITADGLDVGDTEKIRIGTGNDLNIYHDGTNSYVHNDNGSGWLRMQGDAIALRTKSDSNETYLTCSHNGGVELFYDNSKKLETTSAGATVTGVANATTGFQVNGTALNLAHLANVHDATPSDGQVLKWINANSRWEPAQDSGAGGASLSDGDYGDITVASSGSSFTIDNDVITGAKIADDAVGAEHIEVLDAALQFGDSVKAQFGTDNDLELYHDGSHSWLTNSTGNFVIRNNAAAGDIHIQPEDGEEGIIVRDNGAVELFYDNSKKFETTSTGVLIDGSDTTGSEVRGDFRFKSAGSGTSKVLWDASADEMRWNDTYKATFGDDGDLVIKHDGSNSYISETGTGELYIQGNSFVAIRDSADGDTLGKFIKDGAVELYYDNSKKLETTSVGAQITGRLVLDGGYLHISGSDLYLDDNRKAYFGNSGDLQIYHSGSHAILKNDVGNTYFYSKGAETELGIVIIEDGACELYYDNSKKLETSSTGVKVTANLVTTGNCSPSADGGGNLGSADYSWYNLFVNNDIHVADNGVIQLGDGNDLKIFHDGTDSKINNITGDIYIQNTGANDDSNIYIRARDGENSISCLDDGAVEIYYDGVKKFETDSSGLDIIKQVSCYSDNNKDEGQIKINARGEDEDNDLIWIGTTDSNTSKYKFSVDGAGQITANEHYKAGVQKNNSASPTYHYNSADRIRFLSYRGTSDNANYRARAHIGTASSDWDDYRVFYYVDSQADAAVDYDADQKLSMSGSGRIQGMHHIYSGRVESDEGSPNSVYAGAERMIGAYANDGTDFTYIYGRNVADSSFIFQSSVNDEPNVEIEADGSARTDGTWSDTNADYAECFEWTDGNASDQERRGMTVVLDGEKVKLATDSDNKDNIIGVVSPNPVVLGDAAPLGWKGRYKRDVYGSPILKEQEWLVWRKEYTYVDGVKTLCAQPDPSKPQTLNRDTERVRVENIERDKAKGLIPDFAITNNIRYKTYGKDIDTTTYDPTKAYIPRKDRKEWDAIGMVGKLVVRRGQPVGTRWLLMKENIGTDTDGTVLDRYLVR